MLNDQRGVPYVLAENILDHPSPQVGSLRRLAVFDEGGHGNISLSGLTVNGELQHSVSVTDPQGRRVLEMGSDGSGGTGLSMTHAGHAGPGALMGVVNLGVAGNGNRGLEVKDDTDVSVITLGVDPADQGRGLAVHNAAGQIVAAMGDQTTGGGIALFNNAGVPTFVAP